MKGNKEDYSDMENILRYRMTIDFSSLISILKECKEDIKNNTKDISDIKTAINSIREDKESGQNQLQEFAVEINKTSLSISKYNDKIMSMDAQIVECLANGKENLDLRQTEIEKKMKEKLDLAINEINTKLNNQAVKEEKKEDETNFLLEIDSLKIRSEKLEEMFAQEFSTMK